MTLSKSQIQFTHKRQLLTSLKNSELTVRTMVYELDNYLTKFPNDFEVRQLKESFEEKLPQMEALNDFLTQKSGSYTEEQLRERQLAIEQYEVTIKFMREKMNVMLKIDEQNNSLEAISTTRDDESNAQSEKPQL